jgi:hypothetical protein
MDTPINSWRFILVGWTECGFNQTIREVIMMLTTPSPTLWGNPLSTS